MEDERLRQVRVAKECGRNLDPTKQWRPSEQEIPQPALDPEDGSCFSELCREADEQLCWRFLISSEQDHCGWDSGYFQSRSLDTFKEDLWTLLENFWTLIKEISEYSLNNTVERHF